MKRMRFFRGIAVPATQAEETISAITENGLAEGDGWWSMKHGLPQPIEILLAKNNLSHDDTRPNDFGWPAVCACAEIAGAAYYAWRHNHSTEKDTPVLVELEADLELVAVDGKDFLYPLFQFGDSQRHGDLVLRGFGKKAVCYAEAAWASEDQCYRLALCDLAVHDPEVIEAHHASEMTIAGKHGTLFRTAFTVRLPVRSEAILRAWVPSEPPVFPEPDVFVYEIL